MFPKCSPNVPQIWGTVPEIFEELVTLVEGDASRVNCVLCTGGGGKSLGIEGCVMPRICVVGTVKEQCSTVKGTPC